MRAKIENYWFLAFLLFLSSSIGTAINAQSRNVDESDVRFFIEMHERGVEELSKKIELIKISDVFLKPTKVRKDIYLKKVRGAFDDIASLEYSIKLLTFLKSKSRQTILIPKNPDLYGFPLARAKDTISRKSLKIPLSSCSLQHEICHPECVKEYVQWDFFYTNYNVGYTLGNGEHTGILIFGRQYFFDPRRRWDPKRGAEPADIIPRTHTIPNSKTKLPLAPWLNQSKYEQIIWKPNSEYVQQATICATKELVRTEISNHGRSIAKVSPRDIEDLTMIGSVPLSSLLTYSTSIADDFPEIDDRRKKIAQCMRKISDGYCDSVCGNCSYVMPPQSENNLLLEKFYGRLKGQQEQFSVAEGTSPTRTSYLRFSNKFQTLRNRNGEFLDPFTSCYNPSVGASYPQQGYFISPWPNSKAHNVITGLYGHNSNTDAEAQLAQFVKCVIEPDGGNNASCEICGKGQVFLPNETTRQWPCLDETNTAALKWRFTDGKGNVDANLGLKKGVSYPAPVCVALDARTKRDFFLHGMHWRYRVHGM